MKISFEPMVHEHRKEIIDIYNYYVENDFSAYPDKSFPYALEKAVRYYLDAKRYRIIQ
jgi:L-amino acid N-acyltransferase YncA